VPAARNKVGPFRSGGLQQGETLTAPRLIQTGELAEPSDRRVAAGVFDLIPREHVRLNASAPPGHG